MDTCSRCLGVMHWTIGTGPGGEPERRGEAVPHALAHALACPGHPRGGEKGEVS